MLRTAIAALLSATLAVAGCSAPSKVQESDIAGTWCGDDGDRLELSADKAFTLSQVSAKYGGYVFGPGYPSSGTGKWEYSAGSTSPNISLRFSAPASLLTNMGAPEKDLLLVWFTDPDSGYDYAFRRCSP